MTRMLALVGALSLITAGCGGAEDESAQETLIDEVVGRAPAAVEGVPSVVFLDPEGFEGGRSPTVDPVVMDQVGMAFAPTVLVVPRGQTVEFRNSDEAAHNVQVRSMATDSILFNVGTEQNASYQHVLIVAGGYDVVCDIHPGMWATIVVDGARYHAIARDDGAFALRGVPPGAYRARVWSQDDALRFESWVDVTAGRTELALDGGEKPGGRP